MPHLPQRTPPRQAQSHPMLPTPTSTTTVYVLSTKPAYSQSALGNATALPVVPIVAGLAAGILLACGSVLGWILWGRSIERKEARRKQAMMLQRVTKVNTILNTHPRSTPRPAHSTRPSEDETRVKFVGQAAALDRGGLSSAQSSLASLGHDAPSSSTVCGFTPAKHVVASPASSTATIRPTLAPPAAPVSPQPARVLPVMGPVVYPVPKPRSSPAGQPLSPSAPVAPLAVQNKPRWSVQNANTWGGEPPSSPSPSASLTTVGRDA